MSGEKSVHLIGDWNDAEWLSATVKAAQERDG